MEGLPEPLAERLSRLESEVVQAIAETVELLAGLRSGDAIRLALRVEAALRAVLAALRGVRDAVTVPAARVEPSEDALKVVGALSARLASLADSVETVAGSIDDGLYAGLVSELAKLLRRLHLELEELRSRARSVGEERFVPEAQ